jgi:hypothetical protein
MDSIKVNRSSGQNGSFKCSHTLSFTGKIPPIGSQLPNHSNAK